ncbi:MAG TPA: hypothetical protein VF407_07015, partial [Polyangiaceae bacterium]
MRGSRFFLALSSFALLGGCSGGTFVVEGPLAQTRPLAVAGPLGFHVERCRRPTSPGAIGMATERETTVTVGSFTGVASALVHDPATATVTFAFDGKNGDRDVKATCKALDASRFDGATSPPDFSLTCSFVAGADGNARTLVVGGHGSSANTWFNGWLVGQNGEKAIVESQNVVVLGAGAIRGFDLRAQPSNEQIGAIGFFQDHDADGKSVAQA